MSACYKLFVQRLGGFFDKFLFCSAVRVLNKILFVLLSNWRIFKEFRREIGTYYILKKSEHLGKYNRHFVGIGGF